MKFLNENSNACELVSSHIEDNCDTGIIKYKLKPFTYRVRDEWGAFIDRYTWEWFVTHTFTHDIHEEAAYKAMVHWLNMLNRYLYGRRWKKNKPGGVYWVGAFERQKRGTLHIHMLITGLKYANNFEWMKMWEEMGNKNGFSRIYPVESNIKASMYVAKYIAKEGDIYLSDNLPNLQDGFGKIWEDSTPNESNSVAVNPQN
jgi:hypothetical protein